MLGNCTSLPDPYGTDMLLSMIQRGMCGVRERNGVVGIAPPLPEVPASSRCMNNLRAGRWWCYHMAATFASSRAFTVRLFAANLKGFVRNFISFGRCNCQVIN
ncbi:hypothetical protein HanPI659440_Chr10g0370951 [Helianthus annuus]|nr:hypothetical protein HanPI659440_Chr10g0370951 [Helianthus annuus]